MHEVIEEDRSKAVCELCFYLPAALRTNKHLVLAAPPHQRNPKQNASEKRETNYPRNRRAAVLFYYDHITSKPALHASRLIDRLYDLALLSISRHEVTVNGVFLLHLNLLFLHHPIII